MKRWMLTMALAATGAAYGAGNFECKVVDAVVKIPGKAKVESVANRDPKLLGAVFTVQTRTAEVKGSPVYQTEGHKVEVLRSSADEFTVLIRESAIEKDDDVSIITLDRFEGKWSFKHYGSWLGLLTSGLCREL